MKAKYQKYYDALKGKDFAGPVGGYKSALSDASSKLSSVESLVTSSTWTEKGLNTVKGSVIPALKEASTKLEGSLGSLSEVASKVTDLVSQLESLKSLEETLESLGSKWSYTEGGTKTKSEVNSHNNQIDETERKIAEQESAIDGTVAAINGISVESVESTTSGASEVTTEVKKKTDGKVYSSDPAINAKIQQLLGDVDDPNSYDPVKENFMSMRKDILVIDPETGETYNRDDEITIKEGETKRLIVRLPTDTGMIEQITRTTADNCKSKITQTYSDLDPDPDNVEWVRRSTNHWPEDMSLLHTNHYEWVITASGGTGKKTISQTVEYTSSVSGKRNLKAMTRIRVNVV